MGTVGALPAGSFQPAWREMTDVTRYTSPNSWVDQTLTRAEASYKFVRHLSAKGGSVLFIGTGGAGGDANFPFGGNGAINLGDGVAFAGSGGDGGSSNCSSERSSNCSS